MWQTEWQQGGLSLGWNVEAKYKGWENVPSVGVCVWHPQVKHTSKTAFYFLLLFFFSSKPCAQGLRTHPTRIVHLYCWRDKFQQKGITVALEKLVFLRLSHNSGKLHLLVFISDPQNSLVWKTGILEDILLPGCTVFSEFSFSINHNPAVLEDSLLIFLLCGSSQKDIKKNCLKETSCLTCCHYPSRSQDNTSIKEKHLKFRWLNRGKKSAAVDKQGLQERETEQLQRGVPSTATLPFGPGERNTPGLPLTAAKNKVGSPVRYLCISTCVSCTC